MYPEHTKSLTCLRIPDDYIAVLSTGNRMTPVDSECPGATGAIMSLNRPDVSTSFGLAHSQHSSHVA
jgi:hypothetical protein